MSHFRRLSMHAADDEEAEPLRGRLLELVPAGFEERTVPDGIELAAYIPVEVKRWGEMIKQAGIAPQ